MERKEKEGKQCTIQGLKCLYCNADQLLNKLEDLKTQIADECPDIMLFTEVIPKAQRNPIFESQLNVHGYEPHVQLQPQSWGVRIKRCCDICEIGYSE